MSECYEIPDPKYYNGEFGTIQQPSKFKEKLKIDHNLWSIRKNEIRQELIDLQLDG